MSERPGCLFGLPARLLGVVRGRRAIAAGQTRPQLAQPHPAEVEAVQRGRAATQRCMAALHNRDSVSVEVLDQVGSSVQALGDTIEALADRLAAARKWLDRHDAERLRHDAVALELESGGGLAAEQARSSELRTLQKTLQQVAEVEQGIPALRARLLATVRSLEQLEGSVTRVPVDGLTGADGLVARTERQVADTERELSAWQATLAELDGL